VLATGRRHHLLRRSGQPARFEKGGAGNTVLPTAGRGLVVEQGGEIGLGGEPHQCRCHRRPFAGGAGPVDGEVDKVGIACLAQDVTRHDRSGASRRPHKGAAADLADDQATPLGLGIGAAYRADRGRAVSRRDRDASGVGCRRRADHCAHPRPRSSAIAR